MGASVGIYKLENGEEVSIDEKYNDIGKAWPIVYATKEVLNLKECGFTLGFGSIEITESQLIDIIRFMIKNENNEKVNGTYCYRSLNDVRILMECLVLEDLKKHNLVFHISP